jgi:hypothetical protein
MQEGDRQEAYPRKVKKYYTGKKISRTYDKITNYKSQITNEFQITMTKIPNKKQPIVRLIQFIKKGARQKEMGTKNSSRSISPGWVGSRCVGIRTIFIS